MAKTIEAPVTATKKTANGPEWGSDVIVDLLKAYEIPYVSFNPGSTFRGLHDSIVNYGGNTMPEVILCNHEAIAVYVAHGYAAADAIFNAWCDRVPLIALGGTAPTRSSAGRTPTGTTARSCMATPSAIT